MSLFWKPASTYPPRLVSASHFDLLLVIRKSNAIQPHNHAFPKLPYKHKYFPKPFSDAFAFGRVLLFANSRPKLDLSFQIILDKKINARPFPCRAYSTRTNQKQRCAYRFFGNLQVLVDWTRQADRADIEYTL